MYISPIVIANIYTLLATPVDDEFDEVLQSIQTLDLCAFLPLFIAMHAALVRY